ncbi:phage portal protein [uncultured Bacteroides sp.]|uniref:phage portal protein n=1 Tax=uncultured Bacteroides sp. TaxID=162156 RepID=UPI002AAB1D28|nr:phage portal protein [uncultured Bacteroides sp.]
MSSIKEILEQNQDNFGKVVSTLSVDTIENRCQREYLDEYNGKRTRRPDSVGLRPPKKVNIYSETLKDDKGDPLLIDTKDVPVAKIVTNLPKKIVRTSAAFLFGGKMTMSADDTNDGFNDLKKLFVTRLKMQSILKKFARVVLSETKSAIVFFPATTIKNGKKVVELKVKILHLPKDSNNDESYEFYPHFDDDDDMDAFIYKYKADVNGVNTQCAKIWTSDQIISAKQINGIWEMAIDKNLFGLIPVVYAEVDVPEWENEANVLDYLEKRLSRLSDTNDYFAEPILKSYGEADLPSKQTVGKELTFPITIDEETGKEIHGDADYLVWQQSIESVKEELSQLRNELFSGTSTPDLSFDNLKGIGNVSGVSRKFMMMDAIIKASENMEVFGPVVQRCVSVIRAAMMNILDIKYKNDLTDNDIEITFGSILPEDLTEELDNLSLACGGKPFNSQRTIVSRSPYTKDTEEEMKAIEKENLLNRESLGGIV